MKKTPPVSARTGTRRPALATFRDFKRKPELDKDGNGRGPKTNQAWRRSAIKEKNRKGRDGGTRNVLKKNLLWGAEQSANTGS